MRGRAVALAVILCVVAACGGSADQGEGERILSVSAGHDLGTFDFELATGSSAYALDLVYSSDGVESGPFEHDSASSTDTLLVLRPREPAFVDRINIIQMSQNEEWRRLHGRSIDVIPVAPSTFRPHFDEVDSVRIVQLPVESMLALYFNPHDEALVDIDVRRGLVQAIDRASLARIACGSQECGSDVSPGLGAVASLPETLSLGFLSTHAPSAAAASVLRLQLLNIGTELTLHPLSIAELGRHISANEHQLVLNPLPNTDLSRRFGRDNLFGYDGEEFDAAVADGDDERIRSSLISNVLVFPLHEMRTFAAIDEEWCGGKPTSFRSWLWLADLHLCADTQ